MGIVKKMDEVELDEMDMAVDTYIQWLVGPLDGEEKIGLRRFVIKAGGYIPKHVHKEVYHIQFALKGRYIVGIGDKEYNVEKGSVIYIKPGEPHWYRNPYNEDAEFLCVIPLDVEYESRLLEESRT